MDKTTFNAVYEHGILRLDSPLALPEQARVSGLVTVIEGVEGQGEEQSGVCRDLSDDEFERLLESFSMSSAKPLPADFSRADIYSDHD
jgi:hypothetical protein